MNTFVVTCTGGCPYEIEASYYQIKDDILTFKKEDGSPVASFVWHRMVSVVQKNPTAHD